MPMAAIMNAMTVMPTAMPTIAPVLSVELDLRNGLVVATAELALVLEDVVVIIAAGNVDEVLVVKEDADDKDWVEDWFEDWVEDRIEDVDGPAVVLEESTEVEYEDGCCQLFPPVKSPTTCKKPNLRGRMCQEDFRTFAIAAGPRIHQGLI